MGEDFRTFDEFWPFYVRQHLKPLTRRFHFVGLGAGMGCAVALAATRRPAWILAGLVTAYGSAWIAHIFIEKNRPATFRHPVWSLLGDFRMCGLMAIGQMDAEVARAMSMNGASAHATDERVAGVAAADVTLN
jgi:hypothetical protein